MRLPETYLPKTYKGKVEWYISPWNTKLPIHLFRSKDQAFAWAKNQSESYVGGVFLFDVVMTPSFDWFPAGSCPRQTISPNREFVDHREEQ